MRISDWSSDVCSSDLLDEMLGNLIENAAKYGGGSVFATVRGEAGFVEFLIEDDGPGIAEEDRARLFDRGARLDSNKPGTGLGLAIVRDVAEIYDGTVGLEESEDLGGLLARLRLPAASRSEEHTSELQSLMRISYAGLCL